MGIIIAYLIVAILIAGVCAALEYLDDAKKRREMGLTVPEEPNVEDYMIGALLGLIWPATVAIGLVAFISRWAARAIVRAASRKEKEE